MKKELNHAYLGIGSNVNKEQNIERAGKLLRARFVSIQFSSPMLTTPIDCLSDEPFLNQVALIHCDQTPEQITAILKLIEQEIGRRPEDKLRGQIPIDIDLICWNEQILKPKDWDRTYIKEGIEQLFLHETKVSSIAQDKD